MSIQAKVVQIWAYCAPTSGHGCGYEPTAVLATMSSRGSPCAVPGT